MEAIERAGYAAGDEVVLALDVAASEFYDAEAGSYELAGEGKLAELAELVDFYAELVEGYPICRIEDGLDENDWAAGRA